MALTLAASAAEPPAADLAALERRVAAILAREDVPGAGLALVGRAGVIHCGGVGVADRRDGRPVDADTPFRVGSISKSVTAIAIMRLVEEGRLSLEARLSDLAPEVPFANPWEAERPVRLAHLLEHTAGFEFARFNEWFDDRAEPRSLLEALRVNPRSRRSRWPPGTRAAYSNEGYLVAGYLLERATGRPFDEAVRTLALAPLGMDGAAFRLAPALRGRLAQGHGWPARSGAPVPYEEDMMRPAANLIATPRDLARLVAFWLGRGAIEGRTVVSPAGVARMEARRTLPFAGPDDQLGLGVELYQRDGLVGRGHAGTTFGFEAAYRYLPDQGVGWAVLLDGGGPAAQRARDAIEAEVQAFLTARLPRPPAPPAPDAEPAALARLAGFYGEAAPDQELLAPLSALGGVEVSVEAGALVLRERRATSLRGHLPGLEPPAIHLLPAGGGAFRREGEAASTVLFARTGAGEDVLVTASGLRVRRPAPGAWLRWWALALAVGGTLSALVLAPLWVARGWAGGSPGPLAGWLPPVLAALCLCAMLALAWWSPQLWGRLNATTGAFWALSWLFALGALASLAGALASAASPGSLLMKLQLLSISLCGAGLATFAWRAGWIGLRTWRW